MMAITTSNSMSVKARPNEFAPLPHPDWISPLGHPPTYHLKNDFWRYLQIKSRIHPNPLSETMNPPKKSSRALLLGYVRLCVVVFGAANLRFAYIQYHAGKTGLALISFPLVLISIAGSTLTILLVRHLIIKKFGKIS